MSKKNNCFEYLIDILADRNDKSLDGFTTLKLIKLLFLVVGISSAENEAGLTNIFDNFVAMPYGPVESDIYNSIQETSLTKYNITSSNCTKKKDVEIDISDDYKEIITNAANRLFEKNPKILSLQPFELVDITHKWSCWQICYNYATNIGKRSIDIPSEMIQKSVKYYQ